MISSHKTQLLKDLLAHVQADLDVITASQEDAQAGATHAESKAEGDKDMRATEESYLARGLAKRVTELRAAVALLSSMRLPSPAAIERVCLGAVASVEEEDGTAFHYFVAPVGGGVVLSSAGDRVSVITPSSPLGRALLGRGVDEEVELQTPKGSKFLCIVGLC